MNAFIKFLEHYNFNTERLKELTDSDFLEFLDLKESEGFSQPWKSSEFEKLPEPPEKEVKEFLEKEVQEYLNKAKPHLEKGVLRVLKEIEGAQVLFDEKKLPSILNKIDRGFSLNKMNDLLRCQVLQDSPQDAKKINNLLKEAFEYTKTEYKKYGTYPDTGYWGSYHLIVRVKGVLIEIQIMPKTLWVQKEMAHDFYKKVRTALKRNPEYKNTPEYKEERKKSHRLFQFGNGQKFFKSY